MLRNVFRNENKMNKISLLGNILNIFSSKKKEQNADQESISEAIATLNEISASLDDEYGALQAAYNDGRINTAQHNYFHTHPRYIHSFYEMVSWYWRCVSVLNHIGDLPHIKTVDLTMIDGAAATAQGVEHTNPVRLDNFVMTVSQEMVDAIGRDLKTLNVLERSRQEDVMTTFTFCNWFQVVSPADLAVRDLLGRVLKPEAKCAVFGSVAPVVEVMCHSLGAASPVTMLGPVQFDSAVPFLRTLSLEEAECAGERFDVIVVNQVLAEWGMGFFGEETEEGGDTVLLDRLAQILTQDGIIVCVLPFSDQGLCLTGYARCYDSEMFHNLTGSLDLVDATAARDDLPIGFGPDYRAFALRALNSNAGQ